MCHTREPVNACPLNEGGGTVAWVWRTGMAGLCLATWTLFSIPMSCPDILYLGVNAEVTVSDVVHLPHGRDG